MNKENLRKALVSEINKELAELTRRRKERSNFKRAMSGPHVAELISKINEVGLPRINVTNKTPTKTHLPKSPSAPALRKLNFR
jgi:hypothetical protein